MWSIANGQPADHAADSYVLELSWYGSLYLQAAPTNV